MLLHYQITLNQDYHESEFKIYFEYENDVLIDSGSVLKLIDKEYCKKCNIPYDNTSD